MDDFALAIEFRFNDGTFMGRTWRQDKAERNGLPRWLTSPPHFLTNIQRQEFPDHIFISGDVLRGYESSANRLLMSNDDPVRF